MTRVLLAPDKFKGTLTAAEVAGHLADGIRSAAPATDIVTVPVSDGGDGLLAAFAAAAVRLDLSGLHPGLGRATLEVACDVDNPLTGSADAAAVYGPQKGADPEQVRRLDAALSHWADVVAAATGTDHRRDPGAGAAGGAGFAAIALLGARPRPGARLVLDAMGFGAAVADADLVVTGEGSLDEQTLHGKAPAAVAGAARAAGVPVVAVVGRRPGPAPGRGLRRRVRPARRVRVARRGARRAGTAAARDRRPTRRPVP
ncbi:MAG TPA: glycerate kinase [Trebonia sp.]|jgi:glycerate kinase